MRMLQSGAFQKSTELIFNSGFFATKHTAGLYGTYSPAVFNICCNLLVFLCMIFYYNFIIRIENIHIRIKRIISCN